jgi:prevent-host-death family protein
MSSPADCFQTLDVTRFRRALANLHERVGEMKGRVEVTRRGSDDVCVLISKAELDSLEAALEILTRSAEYKAMCDTVTQLAAATGTPAPAACAQA